MSATGGSLRNNSSLSQGLKVLWFEQTIADVPATDEWLAPAEQEKMRAFRVPKRASDWRLGRWTAKRALAHSHNLPGHPEALSAIEIVPADSGAPFAFVEGKPSSCAISISHSHGRAACATAPGNAALGCDVECIESRSDAFLSDYFTAQEQEAVAHSPVHDRALLHTLIWSAKESAMKAVREGLRLDTRSVSVCRVGQPSPWSLWAPLAVRTAEGKVLEGWWHAGHEFVRTVLSDSAMRAPSPLSLSQYNPESVEPVSPAPEGS